MQFCFMQECKNTDAIFIVRQQQEKSLAEKEEEGRCICIFGEIL